MPAVDPALAEVLGEASRRLQRVITEALNAECDVMKAEGHQETVIAAAACNASGSLLANALTSQIEPHRRQRIGKETLRFIEIAIEDSLYDAAPAGSLLQ